MTGGLGWWGAVRALPGVLALACGGGAPTAEVDLAAQPIGDAECAVCGMVVGEQPSPRGQAVYRDGAHLFACSLGDLRALLQAPSPRGAPVAVYVEALPEDVDPAEVDTAPRPWIPAASAWFVFGAERPRVMGLPILSFSEDAVATAVAGRYGTRPVSWDAVASTPFHEVPAAARSEGPGTGG